MIKALKCRQLNEHGQAILYFELPVPDELIGAAITGECAAQECGKYIHSLIPCDSNWPLSLEVVVVKDDGLQELMGRFEVYRFINFVANKAEIKDLEEEENA